MRSTMTTRVGAALCRTMPHICRVALSIVGENLTHNAGVAGSSPAPAITVKSLGRKLLAFLDWLVFVPRPGALSTTRSTKPSRNVVFELSVRQIERDRQQRAIDIAWRSGTWPKVLG